MNDEALKKLRDARLQQYREVFEKAGAVTIEQMSTLSERQPDLIAEYVLVRVFASGSARPTESLTDLLIACSSIKS